MAIHRNIRLLAIFNFLHDLDFLAPVAIIYFQQVTGSFALGMSIFSAVMISSSVFEVPTGIFSDMIGRKKTVVYGSIASLVGTLTIAMVSSYSGLLIGAILLGIARAFFSGNNDALLYDSLAQDKIEHRFHDYLGKVSALFQVGLAVSALAGSIIASWSFTLLVWLAVLPKLIMLIISIYIKEPRIQHKASGNVFYHLENAIQLFLNNKKLRLLTIVSALKFAIGESSYVFRSAFVATIWPLWAVGASNMLSNIGGAIGFFISGKVMDRFQPKRILVFEIVFNRIINFIALIFPTVFSPILMSATSVPWGVGSVAQKTLSQREFTDAQRATLGSLGSLVNQVSFAIFSVGLGIIADLLGPLKTLLISHLILLVPLAFYKMIFSERRTEIMV